jgi:hypothetical protein
MQKIIKSLYLGSYFCGGRKALRGLSLPPFMLSISKFLNDRQKNLGRLDAYRLPTSGKNIVPLLS